MKRKRIGGKPLSKDSQTRVNAFIQRICLRYHINMGNASVAQYFFNLGWECFLMVYRHQPQIFLGDGFRGWSSFAVTFMDAVQSELSAQYNIKYNEFSLYEPVSDEIDVPRIEFLHDKHGDFQNYICLRCYLEDLRKESSEAFQLAYCYINGYTLDEAAVIYNWSSSRSYEAYNALRRAMEQYVKI